MKNNVTKRFFWKKKKLEDFSKKEWEALCDRCGKCCVVKLEDVDTSKIYYTNVSCKLLCTKTANVKIMQIEKKLLRLFYTILQKFRCFRLDA